MKATFDGSRSSQKVEEFLSREDVFKSVQKMSDEDALFLPETRRSGESMEAETWN